MTRFPRLSGCPALCGTAASRARKEFSRGENRRGEKFVGFPLVWGGVHPFKVRIRSGRTPESPRSELRKEGLDNRAWDLTLDTGRTTLGFNNTSVCISNDLRNATMPTSEWAIPTVGFQKVRCFKFASRPWGFEFLHAYIS